MEVIHLNHEEDCLKPSLNSHVMALGFFDGVHLGHQHLLNHAKRLSRQKNRPLTAMTFSPHPDELIKGEGDRKYLTPFSVKVEKFARIGCEKLFVVNFNESFAKLSPEEFINQYILDLNAKHVVVGFDFSFGFKARGNPEYLQRESQKQPFEVSVVSKKTFHDSKISSTLIKELIAEGRVHLVPYYLGDYFKIEGFIRNVRSNQAGTKQIEVDINEKYILPTSGLYQIYFHDEKKEFQGYFQIFENRHCEIVLHGKEPKIGNKCTLTFLNRISTTSKVSM